MLFDEKFLGNTSKKNINRIVGYPAKNPISLFVPAQKKLIVRFLRNFRSDFRKRCSFATSLDVYKKMISEIISKISSYSVKISTIGGLESSQMLLKLIIVQEIFNVLICLSAF